MDTWKMWCKLVLITRPVPTFSVLSKGRSVGILSGSVENLVNVGFCQTPYMGCDVRLSVRVSGESMTLIDWPLAHFLLWCMFCCVKLKDIIILNNNSLTYNSKKKWRMSYNQKLTKECILFNESETEQVFTDIPLTRQWTNRKGTMTRWRLLY